MIVLDATTHLYKRASPPVSLSVTLFLEPKIAVLGERSPEVASGAEYSALFFFSWMVLIINSNCKVAAYVGRFRFMLT